MKTIVICGGHISPAVAVMEGIKKTYPYVSLVYIGRKHAVQSESQGSLEYQTLKQLSTKFYSLHTGKISRVNGIKSILGLIRIPFGILQSMWYLYRIKPVLVMGFGGYIGFSVGCAAWSMGYPLVIHEQTDSMGLANRVLSHIASRVLISFPDTLRLPHSVSSIVTGNPMREMNSNNSSHMCRFGDMKKPLVYITGGSLGARSINAYMYQLIPHLISRMRILHQCGSTDHEADLSSLRAMRNALPDDLKEDYRVMAHVPIDEVGNILNHASLVISRSGANTVREIAWAGVPSILIPLPHSAGGEQQRNAQRLSSSGLSIILDQSSLTISKLSETIDMIMAHRSQYQSAADAARALFIPDATDRILSVIHDFIR